jgi:hypothetical protein
MTAMRTTMHKREETKEDGRRIIYYTFTSVEKTQEAETRKKEHEREKHEQAAG